MVYMISTQLDLVNEAKELGIEYLSATGDALFKGLFVQGLGADSEYKKLLVRAVAYVIGKSDAYTGDESSILLSKGKRLDEYDVSQVSMIQESIADKEFGGRGDSKKGKKKTNLPELPEVDFAALVSLVEKERYLRDESCIVGIEMQVEDQHNMGARLQDYGTRLFRFPINGGASMQKVFEAALCMWDSVDLRLGAGLRIDRNLIVRRGEKCLDVEVPVCCVQIFLGKLIFATDEIIKFVKEHIREKGSVEARAAAIAAARDERRAELKSKFGKLGVNVDELYSMELFQEESEDFELENFNDDPNAKELFRALESYELLEFLSIGNLMTRDFVSKQIKSKTVKELYNKMEIRENNVALDPYQANDIKKSSKLVKITAELQEARKEILIRDRQIQTMDEEINDLRRQLEQAQSKDTPERGLAGRRPRQASQRQRRSSPPQRSGRRQEASSEASSSE
jgi:hypothetical protein